ncbi:MAG: cold shock domain-containing protein [Acidobacteria bacterium]|nr:cold shock domain-containing protein [Acidobacteriota bacterium]
MTLRGPAGSGRTVMNGTIKKLTRDRAYGFIRAEDGVDYFFHESELHGGIVFDDIHEGERVVFEPQQGPKGPRAVDIRRAA